MKSSNKVPEDTTNTEEGEDMVGSRGYHRVLLANISEFLSKLEGVNEHCRIQTGSLTMTVFYDPFFVEYQQIRELLDMILELTPGLVGIRRPDMAELENLTVDLQKGIINAKIELG